MLAQTRPSQFCGILLNPIDDDEGIALTEIENPDLETIEEIEKRLPVLFKQ
jgi:hypothetical protein